MNSKTFKLKRNPLTNKRLFFFKSQNYRSQEEEEKREKIIILHLVGQAQLLQTKKEDGLQSHVF